MLLRLLQHTDKNSLDSRDKILNQGNNFEFLFVGSNSWSKTVF